MPQPPRTLARRGQARPLQRPEDRANSYRRGYATERWKAYSKRYRAENLFCVICLASGREKPSRAVDHIKPCKPDDPLFWDPMNHQALCWSCHSRKTAAEDGGFGNKKRTN